MTQLAHSDGTRRRGEGRGNVGGRKSERITVWSMNSSRVVTVSWLQRRNKASRHLVENVVKRLWRSAHWLHFDVSVVNMEIYHYHSEFSDKYDLSAGEQTKSFHLKT